MKNKPASSPSLASQFFRQPKAVWATAFAATVGFMSIGLVDPILTSIAAGLHASPSQVSLLFTSYFAVTALMMLVTGAVSSRLGGRRTLLLGAALIAVFAALSGTSHSVAALVLYRGGWGLGNALFVATALSVIVAAASGGSAVAILLYEAALGLGLSVGPLLGAALGSRSWRYPFYGTASLMVIGFLAIALFLEPLPVARKRTSLKDPLRALTDKGLFSVAVSAFFYNYGFFTVLAFVPFALHMSARATGLIFFGWGVLLALFSVIVAPRLQRRFSATALLHLSLAGFALLLLVMASGNAPATIVAVILAGALMGIKNTVFTEMALEISSHPRPVASAGYNFVRWMAGVIAPYAAPKLAEIGAPLPFVVAAAAAGLAMAVLGLRRAHLGRYAASGAEAPGPEAAKTPLPAPLLVALDGSAYDRPLLQRAAEWARASGGGVEVVHVQAYEVFDGFSASPEAAGEGERLVAEAVAALRSEGIAARGCCLQEAGALIAHVLLEHREKVGAATLLLGRRHDADGNTLLHGSVAELALQLAPERVELIGLG